MRHELQKEGKHPEPCARMCEANAFRIEIRQLRTQLSERDATIARLKQSDALTESTYHDLRTKLVAAGCDPYMLMPEMVDSLIAKVAGQAAQVDIAREALYFYGSNDPHACRALDEIEGVEKK